MMKQLVAVLVLLVGGCAGKVAPGTPEYSELLADVTQGAQTVQTLVCVVDSWSPTAGFATGVASRAGSAREQVGETGTLPITYQDILLGALAAAQIDDGETVARVEGSLLALEGLWLVAVGEELPGVGEELEEPYGSLTLAVLDVLAQPCPGVLAAPPPGS